MNSTEQSHTDEITNLLSQIDKFNKEATNLRAELESERKTRLRLEHRLETIAQNKLRQTRQQTRIMRQQDEVVRDLSCELDQVTQQLKLSKSAKFSWKDKVKELETKLEESQADTRKVRKELKKARETLKRQKTELEDAQTIVELYEQLKVQSRTEEVRLGRERKSFLDTAQQIYKSYRNVQAEMTKSEAKMKEKLSKSAVFPVKKEEISKREEGKREKVLEKRVNVFKTENAFLKKKVIGLLNQFCAEIAHDQSQVSDIELSFYQKSVKNPKKKSSSILPLNARRTSINKLISSRKNNENENSIFKINTLKLPEINFKNLKEKNFFPINKNNLKELNQVKSSRYVFKSKKDLDYSKEQQFEDCHQSIKSDLVSSRQMKISCIESSSVIGGKTFHVITPKNLRKISKNSDNEKQKNHYISKKLC